MRAADVFYIRDSGDEQLAASYGWKPLIEVYGELPGLLEHLEKFRYELMNERTIRRVIAAATNYLVDTMNPQKPPTLGAFHTPHGQLVLVVKTR
jgi:hypothetical protein